jgi:aspartate kinase
LITNEFVAPESKVEIVTGSNRVNCIEVHDTRMVGEVGFDRRIMMIFGRHDVSYISKMTNANTIDLIVLERDCTPHLMAELSDNFEQVSATPVAIVCAIGSNIAQPGIMAKASQALANDKINILAVSQTTRQTNMQFIVNRDEFAGAQRALHAALCK